MQHFVAEAIHIFSLRSGPSDNDHRFANINVRVGDTLVWFTFEHEITGIFKRNACNLVLEGKPNKGITYSNIDTRKTIVVIGWTTSKGEYTNSLTHEMLHVVQHVSEQFLINMYTEEPCYLLGSLCQAATR